MRTAFGQAVDLLIEIRLRAKNPAVDKAADQLELLCRGWMTPIAAYDLAPARLTPAEDIVFALLHRRLGQAVPREALQDALEHDGTREYSRKGLDRLIWSVRKKLTRTKYRLDRPLTGRYRVRGPT